MNSFRFHGVIWDVRTCVALVCVLLAGCGASAASADSPTPAPTPATTSTAVPASPSPEPQTALELLDCDAGPSDVGGVGQGLAGEAPGGDTPDEALAAFLENSYFVIPNNGYELIATTGDRHAYGFRADGEVKVVLVVSERFGDLVGARFAADELRTCPDAEFGAAAEFNDGRRVWVHETTGLTLTDIAGLEHCGWQSARMLHVLEADGSLWKQYLRDPEGVFADSRVLETYWEGVDLPDDAAFSGYRSPEGYELWFTNEDRAAYVVTPDGVERWPRAEMVFGCM